MNTKSTFSLKAHGKWQKSVCHSCAKSTGNYKLIYEVFSIKLIQCTNVKP